MLTDREKAEKWDKLMQAFPWTDDLADISGSDVIAEVYVIGVTDPNPESKDSNV